MHNLFSPIRVGRLRLTNRLAVQALPSGDRSCDGFISADARSSYVRRAQSGVGLVVVEHSYILPPRDPLAPHVGLYADAQVPSVHHLVDIIHTTGTAVLVMLDQPLWTAQLHAEEVSQLGEAFMIAAWRAHAAGADGIMLSTADGGVFEQLISPLRNQRVDRYGGDPNGRLRLLDEVVSGIGDWIGHDFVVGLRMNVEEFTAGGLTLQDARMIATRLASAGVQLLEVCAETSSPARVARFPGWCVPLAEAIKRVVDIPIMVGGVLGDPLLADSIIRDNRVDLIAIGECLKNEPDWPSRAWTQLHDQSGTRA